MGNRRIRQDLDPDPVSPRKRTGTTVENLGTVAARLGYAWDPSLIQQAQKTMNFGVPSSVPT